MTFKFHFSPSSTSLTFLIFCINSILLHEAPNSVKERSCSQQNNVNNKGEEKHKRRQKSTHSRQRGNFIHVICKYFSKCPYYCFPFLLFNWFCTLQYTFMLLISERPTSCIWRDGTSDNYERHLCSGNMAYNKPTYNNVNMPSQSHCCNQLTL